MSETTVSELIARPVSESVMPLLAETLAAEGLPTDDLNYAGNRFFEFRDCGGTLVGFAGLQQFDSFALLRSVVVFPRARTQANGTSIVNWLAAEAAQRAEDADAARAEQRAAAERRDGNADAALLEQQARLAETRADAIDPEEKQ